MWQLSLLERDRTTPRASLAPQTYASAVALGRDSWVDAVGRLSALVSRVHLSIRATGHDATLSCTHKGSNKAFVQRAGQAAVQPVTKHATVALGDGDICVAVSGEGRTDHSYPVTCRLARSSLSLASLDSADMTKLEQALAELRGRSPSGIDDGFESQK